MIAAAARGVDLRLAPYRRVEPDVFPDWIEQLQALRRCLTLGGEDARRAVRAFASTRVTAAGLIVAAVEDLHPRDI